MEQTNPMSFEIRLTARELWQFSLYHSYKGMPGLFSLIFTGTAVFLLLTTWASDSPAYRGLLVICALMFTVLQPGMLYAKAAKQAKNPGIRQEMTLSFSKEGIMVSQGDENLDLLWENVGRVERIKPMLIVYMDRIHAYLLPVKALKGRDEELRSLLREQLPPERLKRV